MTSRRFAVLAAGAVLASVAATSTVAATMSAAPAAAAQPASRAQIAAAQAVLQRALVARQQVVVPAAPKLGVPATSARLQALVASARPIVAGLFSGNALTVEIKMVSNAAAMERNPTFQALGGGADAFRFRLSSASASSITIAGTYHAWSKVAQIQSGGKVVPATPSNLIDFTATLTKGAEGLWRVSLFTWNFHPGSEP